MDKNKKTATWVLFAGNIFLFLVKIVAGFMSHSLAVISDAFNSLTDILGSVGVFISLKVGAKEPDEDHPFGHHRAEPIAGLIIAILAGILGFEVIKQAFLRLLGEPVQIQENLAFWAMGITVFIKGGMGVIFFIIGKRIKSPAVSAAMIDAINDILIGFVVISSIVGVKLGYPYFDSIAGLCVGFIVVYSGFKIGRENIDYLMGKAAPPEIIDLIRSAAIKIEGVRAINDVYTHYVGNVIHVEVHIEVDPVMKTRESHDLGKEVKFELEKISQIDRAFIHIDPHYEL